MKSTLNDNNQIKYRRHSVRLFNDDLFKLNKSDDETYIEHDSSSTSSFSTANNIATTSFTATSSSSNTKSDSNDTIPSTSKNHSMPSFNQQHNRYNKASEVCLHSFYFLCNSLQNCITNLTLSNFIFF